VRVLIDYRPALRQRTGVGEYAHQLAAALLRRLRPDDSLVLFSSSWKDRLSSPSVPGAQIVDSRVPVRVLNRLWHRWEWPQVETLAGPLDVVHSMHPLLIPARRAAQVITIHDLYFLDHPEDTEAEIRRDYAAFAGAHARRADAVIAVSEYTAAQVRSRFGVEQERLALCPPGAPDWKPRAARPPAGPILFVGTLEPRKNVGALLEAYARLLVRLPAAPELVLAGRASGRAAELLASIARAPLAGRVRHIGYVSGDELQQLYHDAAVLVMPSLEEGFGLPALQAMTVGVPVVASNRGALPEVVADAGRLVDATDAEAMASAIHRVLTEPALASECAERGLRQSARFTWDASAGRLLDAYHSAVARRRMRRA
jgi:glycosyltransferase involved in cell wall biosynthesis